MNNNFKYKVVKYYCIIFYILMLYKWSNGLFLYQLQPHFFYTRQDIFTWLFMQTGIHQWMLHTKKGFFIADLLFYSPPLIYFLLYRYRKQYSIFIAILMLLINWCYIQCYTIFPTNSIESYIAWLLFPIVLLPAKEKTFQLLFEGLRYFFLFFFASAALWKFLQGGIYNVDQMSGILLTQHNQMLTNSAGYWQTGLYLYLIAHPYISYLLYVSATILEASFIIGFFTKKYDRLLVAMFIAFLLADVIIMRITYFEVSALLLTLLLKSPENERS